MFSVKFFSWRMKHYIKISRVKRLLPDSFLVKTLQLAKLSQSSSKAQ